jgi:hypothetical protein
LSSTQSYTQFHDYDFYIKLGSGVSCSQSANVCAPNPPWNVAVQGYNAHLGNCPIAALSVGCELWHALDVEFTVANRSLFKYRKFQTPTNGDASYTRTFDLDVTSVLFDVNMLGRGISCLHKNVGCGAVYPLIGVGIGGSNMLITNYRTIGLAPTGDSSPYASFSAENEYTLRKNVTYTLRAGFEYSHDDSWAISTGYRWFDAGHFNGPQYQRVASGAAVDVGCDAWKMRFRAHEWFIEFKNFI